MRTLSVGIECMAPGASMLKDCLAPRGVAGTCGYFVPLSRCERGERRLVCRIEIGVPVSQPVLNGRHGAASHLPHNFFRECLLAVRGQALPIRKVQAIASLEHVALDQP